MYTKFFQTGGFTIQVNSELPFKADTFHPKFVQFEVDSPGLENIIINHYFNKTIDTQVTEKDRIYFKKPWAVYKKKEKIIYEWIRNYEPYDSFFRKIITNKAHTKLDIFNDDRLAKVFEKGMLQNITLLPTDQILLCRVLGFHQGCLLHSIGLIFQNNGYLFIGHSGAGKTTMAKIMKDEATILCDDRNIVRYIENEYRVFGTWRHSDLADISSLFAPLKGIFFLNKSINNQLELIEDKKQCFFLIMDHLVKSLATHDWMEATIDLVERLSREVNCYRLHFDKTDGIKKLIADL